VLKATAACKQVLGNVEDVIGFRVGQVHLEDRTDGVDRGSEPELFHHLLHDAKATGIHSLDSVRKLELNGWRSNDRRLAAPIFLLNFFGPRDARVATTAVVNLFSLENLLSCGVCCSSLITKHRKNLDVFVFLQFSLIR
jgi:hypothetical protein